jgi:hypothetical protein
MSNHMHGIITLAVIAIALFTTSVQGQVKGSRDRTTGTKKESPQAPQLCSDNKVSNWSAVNLLILR